MVLEMGPRILQDAAAHDVGDVVIGRRCGSRSLSRVRIFYEGKQPTMFIFPTLALAV
jgi:hypothetical protein